jgi:hypothetical protein
VRGIPETIVVVDESKVEANVTPGQHVIRGSNSCMELTVEGYMIL